MRIVELGKKVRGFYIRDEGFPIANEKLVDMNALTAYILIPSCDTQILRSIGKECKQKGLQSSQRQCSSRLTGNAIIAQAVQKYITLDKTDSMPFVSIYTSFSHDEK